MKTTATYHESYQPKQGFGARLLFYAFLLSIIGLSKAFAQVPASPTALPATNATCTSFTANWGSVSGATAYFIDLSLDSNFVNFVGAYNNLNVGNVTTYNITGLNSPAVYYYRVRATDGTNSSSNSNTIAVTFGPTGTITATPISQTICSGNSAFISLTSSDPNTTFMWTNTQSGVTGAMAGNGNIIQDQLVNTSSNAGSVTYIITPMQNGCNGASIYAHVTVFNQGSGITFSSPLDGATVNNLCELNFCGNDTTGQYNEIQILDLDFNLVAYAYNQLDSFCATMNSYYMGTIPVGTNTFYLFAGSVFYDTITINVTSPIVSLQNQVTYTQTAQPNGVYDFTVNGLSGSETYTVVLNNYYGNQPSDTLLVSNVTSATISHQYPYNGDFYGDLIVIAGCGQSTSYDSLDITVTNSACNSHIALNYASLNVSGGCTSGPAILYSSISYNNLSINDSSQLIINWGDYSIETVQLYHGGNISGYLSHNQTHVYNTPGTYTVLITVYNENACYVDTLIQSITIGSTTCGNLLGTIYNDANNNCSQDIGEGGIANVLVYVTPGGYGAWTDNLGNYAFNSLPAGTYTIQVGSLSSGYSVTCSNSQPQGVTISSGTTTVNFAASCNGAFDAAITGISLWSGFFPGQADGLLPHVGLLNAACNSTVVSGQVKIVLDACIQYTGPSTWSNNGAPDAIIPASTGDTLVWNIADINNIGNFSYWDYAVNTLTCTTAQVGDSACITMMILPTNGDADPTNNTYTRCFEIGVSYDPNNKEVMPAGDGAQGFIPADQPSLTYTLNFQNTGTAKAWNIYVMDTIDTDLDINSIEILSASHKMQVYTLPNRAVKFMFADIMLADSTHDEPNSHGYVTFKIKVNAGLAPGTEIENTGHIYFDYNEPVVTNTTLNTIEFPSSVQAIGKSTVVKVFPNPAKESVTVVSTSNSEGTITITDLLGKTVREVTTTNDKTVVNTADLQSGVYFIKLTQNNVSKTEKIMIAK